MTDGAERFTGKVPRLAFTLRVIDEPYTEERDGKSYTVDPHWSLVVPGTEEMVCAGPMHTLPQITLMIQLAKAATNLVDGPRLDTWLRSHDLAGNRLVETPPRIILPQ